jgi:hypothetical protein
MDTAKRVQVITHHPKAADASLEQLRRLAGIVVLRHPVPTPPLWDDDETPPATECASD